MAARLEGVIISKRSEWLHMKSWLKLYEGDLEPFELLIYHDIILYAILYSSCVIWSISKGTTDLQQQCWGWRKGSISEFHAATVHRVEYVTIEIKAGRYVRALLWVVKPQDAAHRLRVSQRTLIRGGIPWSKGCGEKNEHYIFRETQVRVVGSRRSSNLTFETVQL